MEFVTAATVKGRIPGAELHAASLHIRSGQGFSGYGMYSARIPDPRSQEPRGWKSGPSTKIDRRSSRSSYSGECAVAEKLIFTCSQSLS